MDDEFTVYVLYSLKFDKIYIGYTSNLVNRFHSHNSLSKKGYTIKYRPWLVAYIEIYNSKSDARIPHCKRNNYIKSSTII